MVTETFPSLNFGIPAGPVQCACLIHGEAYGWEYVDRLYNMLNRHLTTGMHLHVYTEADRPVPGHMTKHVLPNWKLSGPKKTWWYKLELFNQDHYMGPMLYFDLDTVITSNIDWITQLDLQYFWAVRDFKYLWRPSNFGVNTSVMWFHTARYHHVYQEFHRRNMQQVIGRYHGDQDFVNEVVDKKQLKFLTTEKIQSWRWQALDGGYNFQQRKHMAPGTGTNLTKDTSILVFHGHPKPSEIHDTVLKTHWV
jgi:hypothetical protein